MTKSKLLTMLSYILIAADVLCLIAALIRGAIGESVVLLTWGFIVLLPTWCCVLGAAEALEK